MAAVTESDVRSFLATLAGNMDSMDRGTPKALLGCQIKSP
jgi:hypothetical protein